MQNSATLYTQTLTTHQKTSASKGIHDVYRFCSGHDKEQDTNKAESIFSHHNYRLCDSVFLKIESGWRESIFQANWGEPSQIQKHPWLRPEVQRLSARNCGRISKASKILFFSSYDN